jgi:hypothetical protein
MDDMQHDLTRVIEVVMMIFGALALILFALTLGLGRRWVRREGWRALVWLFVALTALNGWAFVMAVLDGEEVQDNPALWLIAGLFGPALAGLALGSGVAMLRRPR